MTGGVSGWVPLLAGLIGVLVGPPLVELSRRAIVAIKNKRLLKDESNNNKWGIPGAPQQRFKLREAACLLAELRNTEQWPLTDQKAKDEYSSLVKAAHECRIRIILPYVGFRSGSLDWKENQQIALRGEEVTKGVEVKLLDGRTQYTQRLEALRDIEVDRKDLRAYLKSQSRAIPKFLDERFDSEAI